MARQFGSQTLYEDLLAGGISPRRINRLLAELRDHYEELTASCMEDGLSYADAQTTATKRMGSEQEIAEQILQRPELRSWTARLPWMFYIFVPVVGLIVTIILVTSLTVMGVLLGQWLGHIDSASLLEKGGRYSLYAAPALLSAAICWFALVRRSPILWPVLGIIAVAYFGGSFDLAIGWAESGEAESVSVNSSFIYPFPDTYVATFVRGSCTTLAVWLFYACMRASARIAPSLE